MAMTSREREQEEVDVHGCSRTENLRRRGIRKDRSVFCSSKHTGERERERERERETHTHTHTQLLATVRYE